MKINTALLKLTAFYVGVIMLISIGFSFAIFQISSKEINRGLGKQGQILRGQQKFGSEILDEFELIRKSQIEDSLRRLKTNLLYYNLIILLLSSYAGYYFARFTLKPLEDAIKEQDRFTADASHELKTPLAAIKSEIEVGLRDKNLSAQEARKVLTSNLEEIDKLQSLAGALLKLSRFDDENRKDFSQVNLDEIITQSFEKIDPLAKKKKIEIDAKLIKSKIKADKESLVELFIILFDNAIKYSPKNSKIKVRIVFKDRRYQVSVKDQGIGIKSSDIPHIFDRFYRADQSRSKEQADGYGLGLSIAKRIAELHKAKISLRSNYGKGTEFLVDFPL